MVAVRLRIFRENELGKGKENGKEPWIKCFMSAVKNKLSLVTTKMCRKMVSSRVRCGMHAASLQEGWEWFKLGAHLQISCALNTSEHFPI